MSTVACAFEALRPLCNQAAGEWVGVQHPCHYRTVANEWFIDLAYDDTERPRQESIDVCDLFLYTSSNGILRRTRASIYIAKRGRQSIYPSW